MDPMTLDIINTMLGFIAFITFIGLLISPLPFIAGLILALKKTGHKSEEQRKKHKKIGGLLIGLSLIPGVTLIATIIAYAVAASLAV